MKKRPKVILITILVLIVIILTLVTALILVRYFSEKQIDDVSPGIPCSQELLKKSDVLYIIPKFNNQSIAENKSWCQKILSLNKTLELHGITHKYQEFDTARTLDYIAEGVSIFESCFNKTPDKFKPPQLAIAKENKRMINKYLKVQGSWNQLTHKVYHCSDTRVFPNWFIDLF